MSVLRTSELFASYRLRLGGNVFDLDGSPFGVSRTLRLFGGLLLRDVSGMMNQSSHRRGCILVCFRWLSDRCTPCQ